MSSSLLTIAASGARAAAIELDLTGQNITNASTQGYVRRSADTVEIASASSWSTANDISLSGVTVTGIVRNADAFLQSEARRTGSDSAQAAATVSGLTNIETAVEDSGLFSTIGNFQNAVTALRQNPTDASLRASLLQTANTMTGAFQIAAQGLAATQSGLQGEVTDGVTQINTLAGQLAQINNRLSASAGAAIGASDVTTSDRASLMDQRDSLLDQISQYANIATTVQSDGVVNVNIGGVSGPPLVSAGTANALNATVNPVDGTEALAIGTAPVTLGGGSLAGNQAALVKLYQIGGNLDGLAASIATTVNTQQGLGVDQAGNPGAPLFAGTTAATISTSATDPRAIATAAAGSGVNSADATNLTALANALATAAPAATMSGILTDISGAVQTATTTRTTLKTLSDAAAASLSSEAGVDLNAEAVNLVKFQQAFQASSKVMQTANTVFNAILNVT